MFERFTDRARRVLVLAQEEARLLDHRFIGTECLLLGLIHERQGIGARALASLGISLDAAREKVKEILGPGVSGSVGSPPFTPRAKTVLELALREALRLGHGYVGTEHLLLGIACEGEGALATQVLLSFGADPGRVRRAVIGLLGADVVAGTVRPDVEASPLPPLMGAPGPQAAPPPQATAGRRWSAEVVVVGRRPEDFAAAYDQLVEIASRLGLENLDGSRLRLCSVETGQGPGLRMVVTDELPLGDADGRSEDAGTG